jgi:hypothetical protein
VAESNSNSQAGARQLPDIVLKAVVSGREISLGKTGLPLVLVFHAQDTARDAIEMNKSVRSSYPDPAEVMVASVIDLRSFPSMFKGMVEGELEKAYHNAVGRLPEGFDPSAHVILLPDWEGIVFDFLGIKNANAQAAVVAADRQGRILCQTQKGDLGAQALDALQNL